MRLVFRRAAGVLLLSALVSTGCSDDGVGVGYCVVTGESADERGDGNKQGELVRADSGCIADELLVCGSLNSRDEFVSDDCPDGAGAPSAED